MPAPTTASGSSASYSATVWPGATGRCGSSKRTSRCASSRRRHRTRCRHRAPVRADLRHRPGPRAERPIDPREGRPGQQHRGPQHLGRAADGHPSRRHVDMRHVAPLAVTAMAHAAALAHRDELDRLDGSGRPPLAVHHLGRVQLDPPGQEPLATLGAADEAHVLAVGLARRAQPEPVGVGPHLVLGHVAHGEDDAGQRVLAEHRQHVGLVLEGVGAPAELPADDAHDPPTTRAWWPVARRWKPSRSARCSRTVELHGAVALDARVGRPPQCVLPHVGRHDVAVELLGQVEDVMGDAQLLGHPAGVLDVGHRAAARVRRPAPQLQRGADHLVALLHQERGRHGGVDASRHGHEHPHGTSVPPGRPPSKRSALGGGVSAPAQCGDDGGTTARARSTSASVVP